VPALVDIQEFGITALFNKLTATVLLKCLCNKNALHCGIARIFSRMSAMDVIHDGSLGLSLP
jgi:hypothetical protein